MAKVAPGGRKPPVKAVPVSEVVKRPRGVRSNGFDAPLDDGKRCTFIKRNGERCKNRALVGTHTCKMPTHGGRFPSVVAKSRLAKATIALAKRGYGNNLADENHVGANPVTGYLWELRRTAGNIITCEEYLADLDPSEVIWGRTKREVKDAAVSYGDGGQPQDASYVMEVEEARVHNWAGIYLKERTHYASLLKIGISAGLEERRIRLQETLVLQLNGAIANIAANLGADPNSPEVRRMIRDELIALERPEDAASSMEP